MDYNMINEDELKKALIKAHKSGDIKAADFFSRKIKELRNTTTNTINNGDLPPSDLDLAVGPKKDPVSPYDKITGMAEAALTTASGATTGALGFLGGTVEGIIKNLSGEISQDDARKLAQDRASGLIYEPKTDYGKEIVNEIADVAGVLPPIIGAGIPSQGFSSVAKTANIPKSKNKTLSVIEGYTPENVKKSFSKKTEKERFEPRIFNMIKKAREQGFDDSVTSLVANSSPSDRRKMLRMVSIVEKGKKDAREKALVRTADVAGDALIKKINFVKSNNKQAGQQLNRIAKNLKGKNIDIDEPVSKFFNDMGDLGVLFDDSGKPLFSGSQIEGVTPAENLIKKIALRIKRNPNPDALEAHQFKKFIDENISFEKLSEGLTGKTESVVKKLRTGVNDSISSNFDKYAEANKRFSETIKSLDELQDVAGRKLDFSGPNADKAAGVLLRSQTNNTKGRANLLTAIKKLEETAQKYGGSFDDDILNLSIFSDELDAVFGSGARTSLRGEVGKAGVDTAIDISQMTLPGALAVGAKAGAKKLRGVNEKNKLKAIKDLLNNQGL